MIPSNHKGLSKRCHRQTASKNCLQKGQHFWELCLGMRDSLTCFHFLRPPRKISSSWKTRLACWILLLEIYRDNYCIEHSMRLNPKKCNEMIVNFMGNPNTIMRPLYMTSVYEKPNLRPSSSRPFNKFTTTKRLENIFTFKYSSFEYPSWVSF